MREYCCIIGVIFSVALFLMAAALISVGVVVMCSLSVGRGRAAEVPPGCGAAQRSACAYVKAAILPLSPMAAERMRADCEERVKLGEGGRLAAVQGRC